MVNWDFFAEKAIRFAYEKFRRNSLESKGRFLPFEGGIRSRRSNAVLFRLCTSGGRVFLPLRLCFQNLQKGRILNLPDCLTPRLALQGVFLVFELDALYFRSSTRMELLCRSKNLKGRCHGNFLRKILSSLLVFRWFCTERLLFCAFLLHLC